MSILENAKLYETILKRKSVRKFQENLRLSEGEMALIKEKLDKLIPLIPDIKTSYQIVPREETTCKFKGEYCLLIYSENKEGYLQNAGYLFEQFDLFLASINVGVCWYGWGRTPQKKLGEQQFVIMMNFGKSKEEDFRSDLGKVKRKNIEDFWRGEKIDGVTEIVRYSPSACNSQPWEVSYEGKTLSVCQKSDGKFLMGPILALRYNKIDIGIFLCILELCLSNCGFSCQREISRKEEEQMTVRYILDK